MKPAIFSCSLDLMFLDLDLEAEAAAARSFEEVVRAEGGMMCGCGIVEIEDGVLNRNRN